MEERNFNQCAPSNWAQPSKEALDTVAAKIQAAASQPTSVVEELDNIVNNAPLTPTEEAKEQSFLDVCSFAEFVEEGNNLPEAKEIVKNIVVEEETTMLFGDTGTGKTVLAVQMANYCAQQGYTTLYCNFELSQGQMAKRYQADVISKSLFILNIDYAKMHDVTDQSLILGEIEKKAFECGATVIFIDNLTNLCINSKEGSEAGKIMLQLITLRLTHNWTMVVLAHVPKRKPGDPLTLNDLAGSKIISNLADNVVGLNKSKKGKDKRYIIQLKYRSFPIELDYKNVQELTLTTSEGYLHFEYGDFAEERTHLPRSRDEKAELERDIVKELKEPNGLSYRDIADKLGTSLGTVQRVAKSNNLSRKSDKGKK